MPLKNKTIIALTVKLLFCSGNVQAQHIVDSSIQKPAAIQVVKPVVFVAKQPALPLRLPGDYYAKQLPFFCSKELLVQKTVGFPVKFRLGSVAYCDWLEGKNR